MDPFGIVPANVTEDEHVNLILTGILILLFKDRISQFVSVMGWKMGRRYNENMKIIVDGYYARINKIGLFYVEFYMYNKINQPPDRGWSWKVAGNKLDDLHLWIPLEKHEPQDSPIQTITTI